MPQRNRATSWVHLLVVQAKHIHAVDGHGSECLVDFKNIDIIFGELELGKELWNSN